MITRQMLFDAPMFSAFKGPAENRLTREQWALFRIDGGRTSDEGALEEACKHGLEVSICESTGMFVEPEFDEDWRDEIPDGDDSDAVLAYLADGGMVAKIPDKLGSPYYRFYTIMHAREWFGDKSDGEPNMTQDNPDLINYSFVSRLYELFPELKEFDEKTGEVAMFEEALSALARVLPDALAEEPLVVGTYMLRIMSCPGASGNILAEAWKLNR